MRRRGTINLSKVGNKSNPANYGKGKLQAEKQAILDDISSLSLRASKVPEDTELCWSLIALREKRLETIEELLK